MPFIESHLAHSSICKGMVLRGMRNGAEVSFVLFVKVTENITFYYWHKVHDSTKCYSTGDRKSISIAATKHEGQASCTNGSVQPDVHKSIQANEVIWPNVLNALGIGRFCYFGQKYHLGRDSKVIFIFSCCLECLGNPAIFARGDSRH